MGFRNLIILTFYINFILVAAGLLFKEDLLKNK
jgi:hypothetical protein